MLNTGKRPFTPRWIVVALVCCPSLSASAAEPALTVKPGRGASNAKLQQVDGATVVEITSAGGIGQATVQSGGQPWPMKMKLRLRYDAKRPFTHLEGFNLSDSKSRLHTFLDSESVEVEYADGAARLDTGKPELQVRKVDGAIEITLPMAWLADEKEFTLHWIDFYRG